MNIRDSVQSAIQRYTLKRGVKRLSLEKQVFFKKLYGTHYENNAPKRSLMDTLGIEIDQVIDEMSVYQLRTAIMQIDSTLKKEREKFTK